MKVPPPCFTLERFVEFSETDMAGIVHFSNFFRYMEMAEAAFFRQLGCSIVSSEPDGSMTGWPRVRVHCSYSAPLRFEDRLRIALHIEALKIKAICYQFRFYRLAPEPLLVAKGGMTTLFARFSQSGHMTSAVPSREVWDKLERAKGH